MIWCFFDNRTHARHAVFAVRVLKRQMGRIVGSTIPT
jgi:hypothetical protein